MSEGTQHITFTNMQRELEASEARHLDLARRYDALAARLAEVEGKLETAEGEAYYWRSLCSEDDRVEQLQRRLAEVEAERDRAQSLARLNSLMGGEGPVMVPVEAARCPDCGSERYRHHRSDVVAERDRLAQRGVELLEKVQLFAATGQRVTQERDEAIGHLRAVMNAERQAPPHRPQEDDEALAFLARFPREGDGDDS